MKLIVELFGRVVGFEWSLLHIRVSDGMEEEVQQVGHDPHSTLSSQVERGPGASEYVHDVVNKNPPRFGFHTDFDTPTGNPQNKSRIGRYGSEG
jgi:hypothetical protein